jgi:hypothetical protein
VGPVQAGQACFPEPIRPISSILPATDVSSDNSVPSVDDRVPTVLMCLLEITRRRCWIMSPVQIGRRSMWCTCSLYFVGDDLRMAQFDFATQSVVF